MGSGAGEEEDTPVEMTNHRSETETAAGYAKMQKSGPESKCCDVSSAMLEGSYHRCCRCLSLQVSSA